MRCPMSGSSPLVCMASVGPPPPAEPPEPGSPGNGRSLLPSLPRYGRALRDVGLFLVGVFIAVHETVRVEQPREALLVLAATAMGLPVVLRKDERK